MRCLRLVLYFLVGLLLGGVVVLAHAETIPATGPSSVPAQKLYGTTYCSQGGFSCTAVAQNYSTTLAAAQALYAKVQAVGSVSGDPLVSGPWSDGACSSSAFVFESAIYVKTNTLCRYTGANVTVKSTCTSGTLVGSNCTGSYSCPAGQNWSLQGNVCHRSDCLSPQVRDPATGVCGAPACSVPTNQNLPGVYSVPAGCTEGCNYCINDCSVYGPFGNTVTSGGRITGTFASNGTSCSSGAAGPSSIPPDTAGFNCNAKGMGFGNVNGVTVCVTPSSTGTTSTSTKTPPAGDPTGPSTTTTSSSTSCTDAGSCTTTTTTNVISGGSGPGGTGAGSTTQTTTKTDDQPQAKFCEENPDSNFCKSLDTPPEEGPLATVTKDTISQISPVSLPGNASCPADIQLAHGAYVTYSSVCQYAEGIKPFVLLSAWLAAGLFVLAMSKQ